MNKFESMSDFEINNAVAIALGSKKSEVHCNASIIKGVENHVETDFGSRDYCNNPAHMWPIIVDNRIALIPFYNDWIAKRVDDCEIACHEFQFMDRNPLRAAAIVFLMMQESK